MNNPWVHIQLTFNRSKGTSLRKENELGGSDTHILFSTWDAKADASLWELIIENSMVVLQNIERFAVRNYLKTKIEEGILNVTKIKKWYMSRKRGSDLI